MKHITINGRNEAKRLEKPVHLHNGDLVLVKRDKVERVLMVTSFRDGKNQYNGAKTGDYCSLIDLDTGCIAFEERCSRDTTVRRVLNHLFDLGTRSYAYNQAIPLEAYGALDIECISNKEYSLDIMI